MRRLLLLLLLCPLAFGQGVRFGDGSPIQTTQSVPGVGTNLVTAIPSATISWCNSPANAVPCTNKATTYTSATLGTPCSTNTQVVRQGSTSCVATTDSLGNWGVWVASGTYDYTVTVNGQSSGPYTVTLANGSGTGSATSIQTNPVSAGTANKVGQGYFQNFANNSLQLETRAFVDAKWDCNLVGDGVTDDSAALNTCIANNPGRLIIFPKTQAAGSADYFYNSTIYFTQTTTTLRGGAQQRGVTGNGVTFKFAPKITGIDTGNNACQGCSIENLHITGQEPSSTFSASAADNILPCNPPNSQSYSALVACVNTGDGVHVTSNFFSIKDSLIEKFGRHGVFVDGGGPTCAGKCADNFAIERTSVDANRGDGLFILGGDTNAGHTSQVNGYYNALYCLEDDGFLGNAHYSPECHTNHFNVAAQGATSNISNIVCAAGACTLTTATPVASVAVGNAFTVAGTTNYNGTFFASTVSSNVITFSNGALSFAAETTGTARLASTANFWAAAGIANSGGGFFSNSINNFRTWIQPYCEADNTNYNLGFRNIVMGGVIGCPSVTSPPPFLWLGAPIPNTQLGFNNLNVGNSADAALQMRMIAGLNTDQENTFIFADHTGTKNNWFVGSGLISALQHFIVADGKGGAGNDPFAGCVGSTACRLDFKTLAESFVNSGGTAATQFNMQTNAGTGGVIFGSGGVGPSQVASVDSTGLGTFTALTVNGSGPPKARFTANGAFGTSVGGSADIGFDGTNIVQSIGTGAATAIENQGNKNVASGYAGLNGSGVVATAQLVTNTTNCDATHVKNGDGSGCIANGGGTNGSTLLNFQNNTGSIAGTGAAADIFSYTIPANTIPAGKCIRVTAVWAHTTGTASTAYTWQFGGGAIGGSPSSANTSDDLWSMNICNNPSVTNAQTYFNDSIRFSGSIAGSVFAGTSAVDTTSNQTIKVRFNVANTDAITGKFFQVELLQ